jgi:hypothetical protein
MAGRSSRHLWYVKHDTLSTFFGGEFPTFAFRFMRVCERCPCQGRCKSGYRKAFDESVLFVAPRSYCGVERRVRNVVTQESFFSARREYHAHTIGSYSKLSIIYRRMCSRPPSTSWVQQPFRPSGLYNLNLALHNTSLKSDGPIPD